MVGLSGGQAVRLVGLAGRRAQGVDDTRTHRGDGDGLVRCSRVQHRTRNRHTRDPNTAVIPAPVRNPTDSSIICIFRNKKLLNLDLKTSVECSRTQWDADRTETKLIIIQIHHRRLQISSEKRPSSGTG